MASRYWIKLYHEMLDDKKVAMLDDSTYRRFIECLLMAGEEYKEGLLPPMKIMTWRLRLSENELTKDLETLASIGLVESKTLDDCQRWIVSKFAKRQAPSPASVRMDELRKRKRKESKEKEKKEDKQITDTTYCYVTSDVTKSVTPVTNRNENVTENSSGGSVFSFYESNIAQLTPKSSELIGAAIDEFGEADVIEAMTLAVEANVRKWSYVNGILKKWREGGKQPAPSANGQQSKQDKADTLLAIISRWGRLRYKDALPELEAAGLVDIVKRAGWTNLCNSRPDQIQWMI